MITCEEAQLICHKKQYREARFADKIRLFLHIVFCKACFTFSRENTRLTRLIRKAPLRCLSQEEKDSIKEHIKQS